MMSLFGRKEKNMWLFCLIVALTLIILIILIIVLIVQIKNEKSSELMEFPGRFEIINQKGSNFFGLYYSKTIFLNKELSIPVFPKPSIDIVQWKTFTKDNGDKLFVAYPNTDYEGVIGDQCIPLAKYSSIEKVEKVINLLDKAINSGEKIFQMPKNSEVE